MIPTTFVMNKLCFTYMQYINYLPINTCKFTYLCIKAPALHKNIYLFKHRSMTAPAHQEKYIHSQTCL